VKGRTLMIAGAALLAVFTGVLWYAQNHAYYRELPLPKGGFPGDAYPIETWRAIEGTSSPLKLRICATVTPETARRLENDMLELAPGEPLVAPAWFECFDAKRISRDLEARKANFYALGPSDHEGIDLVMALYPDGRIFAWPRLDERFRN